jgi:hypothetical protein
LDQVVVPKITSIWCSPTITFCETFCNIHAGWFFCKGPSDDDSWRYVFSPNFNFLRVLRFPLPIKLTVTI